MSSAAAASPVTRRAARNARGQCSRKSRSRSATDPCWAPLIQARSATRPIYDARRSRGPYDSGTSVGPAPVGEHEASCCSSSLPRRRCFRAPPAAACSPLNCAASQFSLADGSLLGFRARAVAPRHGRRPADRQGALDAACRGHRRRPARPPERRERSLVRREPRDELARARLGRAGSLAGVSQDGTRAVGQAPRAARRRVTIVSRLGQQRDDRVAGRQWDFDALRGDNLFLIRYVNGRRLPGASRPRRLRALWRPKPLKDPHESGNDLGLAVLAARVGRRPLSLHALHRLERRRDDPRARPEDRKGALHRPAWDGRLRIGHVVGARAFAG